MEELKLKRAISYDELMKKRFPTMKFDGQFAKSIGEIVERSGNWIIYGESGHGKTEFCLQLSRYLTGFGKVLYNTCEEGCRMTFRTALSRHPFTPTEKRKFLMVSESIEEVTFRLQKRKSADIIFMDSIQHSFITKREYRKLKEQFPNKLFIWISHAEGKRPIGSLASWVEFDSDVKIRVEFFLAMIKSRYQGNEDFIINQERYEQHYNELS